LDSGDSNAAFACRNQYRFTLFKSFLVVPLGLLLLAPVLVNPFLFRVFLDPPACRWR